MKTEAISGGLYRQNLITEILRTNIICKYEKYIELKHVNLSDAKLSKQWQSTQKSTLSFTIYIIYMFEEVSSINHE